MTNITMGYVVSEGTLRDSDLMMAMMRTILINMDVNNPDYRTAINIARGYYNAYGDFGYLGTMVDDGVISSHQSEEMNDFIWEYLWGLCESLSPEGCYFGLHQGDGSLLGYWEEDLDSLF